MSLELPLVPSPPETVSANKRRSAFRPTSSQRSKKTKTIGTARYDDLGAAAKKNGENQPPNVLTDKDEVLSRGEGEFADASEPSATTNLPPATSPKKRPRSTRRNRLPLQRGDDDKQHRSKKKDEAPPPTQSLSAFCSKYRAAKRIKNRNATAPPLAPPPQPEEEVAPAGPQVKIVDGEIVLQESSMVVPNARKTVQEVEEEYQHVVEEEGHTAIVGASYNSFVARRKPQHWTVEETKLFYNTLRQLGTDFVSMEKFFENRTRKQLKKKYQAESIKNPHLIEMALDPRNKLQVDLSVFHVDRASIKVVDPCLSATKNVGQHADTLTAQNEEEEGDEEQNESELVQERGERGEDILMEQDIFHDEGVMDETAPRPAEEFEQEQAGTAAMDTGNILLAPTPSKAVSKAKRPKFRAGKRKSRK
jgi:transcription factor TFIIIB component B''